MNERIKLLADEAEDYSYTEYAKKQTGYTREDFFKSKFAELIVKECLVQIGDAIPDTNCSAADAYKTAKLAATSRVKEHFGVGDGFKTS